MLKAQLPNICEYSTGFALLILPLVMFAFLSVCLYFSASEDWCHLSSNLTVILNSIFW